MYITINNKKRVNLKYEIALAKCDFIEDEFGNVEGTVCDMIMFRFIMPTSYFRYSNSPEMEEKHKDKKNINWSYGIRIKQDEALQKKYEAIHTGINKVCEMLKDTGFVISDYQVSKLELEIKKQFDNFYGDRKERKGK